MTITTVQLTVITGIKQNTETGRWYYLHTNFDVDIVGLHKEISDLSGIECCGEKTRYSMCVKIGRAFDNQSEIILQNVKSVLIKRCIMDSLLII